MGNYKQNAPYGMTTNMTTTDHRSTDRPSIQDRQQDGNVFNITGTNLTY